MINESFAYFFFFFLVNEFYGPNSRFSDSPNQISVSFILLFDRWCVPHNNKISLHFDGICCCLSNVDYTNVTHCLLNHKTRAQFSHTIQIFKTYIIELNSNNLLRKNKRWILSWNRWAQRFAQYNFFFLLYFYIKTHTPHGDKTRR